MRPTVEDVIIKRLTQMAEVSDTPDEAILAVTLAERKLLQHLLSITHPHIERDTEHEATVALGVVSVIFYEQTDLLKRMVSVH